MFVFVYDVGHKFVNLGGEEFGSFGGDLPDEATDFSVTFHCLSLNFTEQPLVSEDASSDIFLLKICVIPE